MAEWILLSIVGVIIAAITLKVVAAVAPGLEIDGFATAMQAACVMILVGAALGRLMFPLAGVLSVYPAAAFVSSLVTTAIGLAVAAAVLSDFKVDGPVAIAIATVLLALVQLARRYAEIWIRTSGVLQGLG